MERFRSLQSEPGELELGVKLTDISPLDPSPALGGESIRAVDANGDAAVWDAGLVEVATELAELGSDACLAEVPLAAVIDADPVVGGEATRLAPEELALLVECDSP